MLPATRTALETGVLSWSAVRELTRVAVAETEQAWLEVARGKTVHQLEALVAGEPRGAEPSSVPSPDARRHVLRFEVAAETFCLFRDAIHELQRDSGNSLDDDSALMLMARSVLGGPRDGGRASYQIALSVCPACSHGYQQSGGELVAVEADVVAMAECDAQELGLLQGSPRTLTSPDVPERATSDAHAGALAEADVIDDAHAGALAGREARRPRAAQPGKHAKQATPPARRKAVLRRDHHRCCVPGCKNGRYVDVHHLQPRSEGGGNQVSNLITVCSVHHRAVHRGHLLVAGSVAEGVSFRHKDGSDYGSAPNPRALEVHAKACAALRNLGFHEGEVRRVLTHIGKHLGEPPSLESILREALARLTSE